MAKIFKFNDECSIIGEATATLKERFCMVVPGSYIAGLYRVLFRSNALMCKYYASKKYHNIGFSLKDENGEFKIGTILTYNAPEEDSDDNGNYVLSNTWYEKDMENMDLSIDSYTDMYATIFQGELFSDLSTHCNDNADLLRIATTLIDVIHQFLDENSNDSNEDVELELESVFTASVSIIDGEKVYSLTPGYSVKQIIKNDDENEKTDAA